MIKISKIGGASDATRKISYRTRCFWNIKKIHICKPIPQKQFDNPVYLGDFGVIPNLAIKEYKPTSTSTGTCNYA